MHRKRRLGVQQFSVAAIVLLILSTSIAVWGLVWSSTLLERTGDELVRAGEGLRRARDFEQALFSHRRLTILAEPRNDEALAVERELLDSIEAARREAPNDAQARLLGALLAQVADYFEDQAAHVEGDASPAETEIAVRPTFDVAVDTARALAQYSELELERGNATAQRLGSVVRLVALIAAALALALVALIGIAVRSMILGPILHIRDALVRFRGGDDGVQANENIARELGEIASAFNDMKAELARRRVERLAFLGGVAHDLRNPLSALKAGVAALELAQHDPERVRHTLGILSRQLDQLERMCGDLLEQSRLEAGALELNAAAFDLRDAAAAVTELYRPAAGSAQLVLELDAEPVIVVADRVRIEQVIGNLLKNAIKHSGQGARISIAVSRIGEEAELAVADNGVGIAADELETIFHPFRHGSAASSRGAGLGLFVVQRIVAAHGGSVGVESDVGAGATFRVRLPLAETGTTTRPL